MKILFIFFGQGGQCFGMLVMIFDCEVIFIQVCVVLGDEVVIFDSVDVL